MLAEEGWDEFIMIFLIKKQTNTDDLTPSFWDIFVILNYLL